MQARIGHIDALSARQGPKDACGHPPVAAPDIWGVRPDSAVALKVRPVPLHWRSINCAFANNAHHHLLGDLGCLIPMSAPGPLPGTSRETGPALSFCIRFFLIAGSLEPIVPLLRDDFRIVLLDLPGFGGSAACSGGLIPLADQIADGMRVICGDERPLLFGNGYGAFLALALAARHPGAISGLFLAGCGAVFSEQGREAFRIMAAKAKEGGLSTIADIAMRRLFTPDMAARSPDVVAERRKSFISTDPDVFVEACEILSTLDLRDDAKRLAMPLLACAGSLDEATPPGMAEELATLTPKGSCTIIPDCAHVPTLQAPAQIAQAIRHFAGRLK